MEDKEFEYCVVSSEYGAIIIHSRYDQENEAQTKADALNGDGPKFFWMQRVPNALIERLKTEPIIPV